MGEYLQKQLTSKLLDSLSVASPYIFDIRGSGGFWGIEFEIPPEKDFKRNPKLQQRFGAMLQTKTLAKGIIILAMDGGADGSNGSHAMVSTRVIFSDRELNGKQIQLAPPYNVTREEIDEMVRLFSESVEELIREVLE